MRFQYCKRTEFDNEMFTKDSKSLGIKLSKEVKSLKIIFDKDNTKTFEFDRLGRIVSVEEIWGSGSSKNEYKYTQNEAGETICTNHCSGCALFIWKYNKSGLLLTTTHLRNPDDKEGVLIMKIDYDTEGRITSKESHEFYGVIKDTMIYEPDGIIVKNVKSGYGASKWSKYSYTENLRR